MVVFNALQTSLTGGIGRYCYELSKSLYKCKKDIKIVIREEDIDLYNFIKSEDLIIVKGIKNSIQRNIYEQIKLPFFIKKKYPNAIIHYPDTMAPIFARNKVVITVHDLAFKSLKNAFTWKSNVWKNIVTTLSVKKACKIVAISEFTKSEIKKVYGNNIFNKATVILNGFNNFSNEEINIKDIRENIKLLKDEEYILTVSTISPRKNIDGLIRAYHSSKMLDKCKLVIAGGKGWLYQEVINLVDELQLKNKVIFTDRISDEELKFLYKNCEIFTYLSYYEGFGLPPLEAMSYGKACVVSDVSSIPEVVREAAVKVNPYIIKDIVTGMEKIYFDKKEREKFVGLGKENLLRFSWDKCAAETLEIYSSIE